MEVADQWRREWAGTAEYGKVTEGGVTRRIARAMEVLHATGPGSRVKVMRAAYHSSAGPGAPAESFMLHSSRRVISSGFNFLESPSLPTKPLEISSTPLELTNDCNGEIENYKVTEPDDLEISEPSKWKGSTRGNSIRMPSEESSSTDNASIIDLDSRSSRNLHRKYSYDSESSDLPLRSRSNSRTSQHIDPPVTLSTLKYKSLLNSSNEWNTRRKSYSFEDTSPLNETMPHSNDTIAMDSSTDSGICKSTEIMNDHVDDTSHLKYMGKDERQPFTKEESFRDWLSKNRQNSQYRRSKFKTLREHEIVMEEPKENNIALQSPGKVSITLPVTIEGDPDSISNKTQITDDIDRRDRIKKVEFCKTEVHFAAESGKVNIIATDEKPPPSNDFRKRRSAFVPMHDMIERPITLYGEKPDFKISNGSLLNHSNNDYSESDENTAATKSILKNKIPKPKPYLLGENMDFGISNINTNNSVLTAVSLVNQQLETEKRFKSEMKSIFSRESERNVIDNNIFRTINAGPTKNDSLKQEKTVVTNIKIEAKENENVKNNLNSLQVSPAQIKPKTRQLRDSDLTYFGVDNDRKPIPKNRLTQNKDNFTSDNAIQEIFQSVKLIQQVSNSVTNSVCNSEPESEETPEYINIPMNINYAPIPTPRVRSKYDDKPNELDEARGRLKPTAKNIVGETKDSLKSSTRRAKVRRQEEIMANRSLSEPSKNMKQHSLEKKHDREDNLIRSSKHHKLKENSRNDMLELTIKGRKLSVEDIPIYVNLNIEAEKTNADISKQGRTSAASRQKEDNISRRKGESKANVVTSDYKICQQKKHSVNKDTLSSSLKRETRTEKNKNSHYNNVTRKKINTESIESKHVVKTRDVKNKNEQSNAIDNKGRKDLQRSLKTTVDESVDAGHDTIRTRDSSNQRKNNSSKDKIILPRESIKPLQKLDSDTTLRHSSAQTKSDRDKKFNSGSDSHKSNKHREYVINYDDKNGTVSSVCKVKASLGSPRRKKTSKEILKGNHKNNNVMQPKIVDKIPLRK